VRRVKRRYPILFPLGLPEGMWEGEMMKPTDMLNPSISIRSIRVMQLLNPRASVVMEARVALA
jgi:hypothetical protein